jgi:AmmeMemoRadiSam system protein A
MVGAGVVMVVDNDRRLLLNLARTAIVNEMRGNSVSTVPPSADLAKPMGVFVTLRTDRIRGCRGYARATHPLYRAVAQAASEAAFRDQRFPPLCENELPLLRIEISVLSSLNPIKAELVLVGYHGLMVTQGAASGLLLPQVPIEHGWNRERFLTEACRKARLPLDAWKHGARIEGFTAEVFNDENL